MTRVLICWNFLTPSHEWWLGKVLIDVLSRLDHHSCPQDFCNSNSNMMTFALTTLLLAPSMVSRVSGSLFKQCALMIPTYSHPTCVTYEDLIAAFDDASSKCGIAHAGEKFTAQNVIQKVLMLVILIFSSGRCAWACNHWNLQEFSQTVFSFQGRCFKSIA